MSEGNLDERYLELYSKALTVRQKYDIVCNCLANDDKDTVIYMNKQLRVESANVSRNNKLSFQERSEALEIYRQTFLITSHYIFEDFMIYLEINRPYKEQFYRPRMKALKQIAWALQDLHDNNLEELFLSMPPRVGKSTIVTFFVAWLMGLNSEMTNLYSSCSDTNTNAFYRGVLEIVSDTTTYTFKEIFPDFKIVTTDAKKNLLDITRKKKYPTLTCRSIGGTLNGSCDCNGLLVADDLISGIEEVLNPERMYKIWKLVDNNLLTRAKENAKILWIGPRWSLIDPIGLRLDTLQNDKAYKNRNYRVINIPALDENDESNFDYEYHVGYSSNAYIQRRASFERNNDLASWSAQYMGEPIEREGALFDNSDMNYYNGELPDEDPVRKLTVVDVAWGGGDFVSAPLAYVYSDGSVYIPAVVFSKANKIVTQPMLAKKIATFEIDEVDFEKNNGGGEYRDGVEEELYKINYKCVITTHNASTHKAKEIRIFQQAPEIRNFYFLEDGKRDKSYQLFMNNLFSYKVLGKNKNDDAPDSLAQLSERINQKYIAQVKIFRRPF